MNDNNSSNTRKVVIFFIIGLIIGFGIGYSGKKVKTSSKDSNSNTASVGVSGVNESLNLSISAEEAAVMVSNQVAGGQVVIDSIVLPENAWVAVRKNDDGREGNTLGAKYFAKGTHANVIVKMVKPTEAGQSYWAVIVKDDGDIKYDRKTDANYTKTTGESVGAQFSAM